MAEEYHEHEQTLAAAEENQINGVVNDSETTKGFLSLKLKIPKRSSLTRISHDDGDDGLGFDDCDSEDILIYDEDEMKMMKQQKKNKKRRLNELDDPLDVGAVKEEPTAVMAAKAVDMHQALGDQVASHNKNKNVKESSSSSASATASEEETGESLRVQAAALAGSSEHKWNICNKTFPTGQAIGGHKSCPAEAFSNSIQVTMSAGEVTQRAPPSRRVVHDFDLNDTPPEYYQFYGVEVAAAATVSYLD